MGNEQKTHLRNFFVICSFIAAGILIMIIISAVSIVSTIYNNVEIAIASSILAAFFAYLIMPILDKNDLMREKFQKGAYNYKWVAILPISFTPTLILLIIYFLRSDLIGLDLDSAVNLNLLVFLGVTILLYLTGFLLYFGIKNLLSIEIHKKKLSIFGTLSVSLLIITGIGFGFLYNYFIIFPSPNIANGTGYNEGPWLTWHDNKPNESICITWLTAEKSDTELTYGTDPNNLNLKAAGSGDYIHKVYLQHLQPETTYYYRIPEDFSEIHDSDLFSFTTASNVEKAFSFAVVGDMQPDNQLMIEKGKVVAEGIAAQNYDFTVQLGDVAVTGSEIETWHSVLGNVAIMGATRPFQAIIGNHDWSGGIGSSNWNALFPYNYENRDLGRFYSFDYHNAHFVMIDNFEHYYAMSDAQINWIKEDLTEAKANGQDWIFCAFHLSMLTTATSGMFYDLQEELVPIFDQYGVDAVFFAHDHDYQHYEYTYGKDGLVYDPSHDWPHHEVHYFCSGGGGGNLEVGYGILDENRMKTTDSVEWWDENLNSYRTIEYERTAWDSSKYVTHDDFQTDYSYYKEPYQGKYYYHSVEEECYHEFAEQIGFQYGEECYHYIELEIDGDQCTISARYPNGEMLQGPGNAYPQQWVLTK